MTREWAEPLMTAQELADYLNVHPNTIKRMVNRGELPCYRFGSRGDYRFRRDLIEIWLKEHLA